MISKTTLLLISMLLLTLDQKRM